MSDGVNGDLPKYEVSTKTNGARDAPHHRPRARNTTPTTAAGDGILTSWTAVSSSLWTATPHRPSNPPRGNRCEAAPPLTGSLCINEEGIQQQTWTPGCIPRIMATQVSHPKAPAQDPLPKWRFKAVTERT
jgi:hypothetical protein